MNEIRKSFYRICNNGLGEKFYEKFLDADPRIRPLFKNTDFTRQKELIVHAIMMLIEYAEGTPLGDMAISRLGELHSRRRMNVTPDLYPIWVDCLMKTVADLDPEFSTELECQWRKILQAGVDAMIKMN